MEAGQCLAARKTGHHVGLDGERLLMEGRRDGLWENRVVPDEAPILEVSVRVLLIDGQDRLLLFLFKSDDGDVWMTPGGAILEGESPEEAVPRVRWEQSGVGDIDVGPCVWLRTHLYPWDGKVYKQQDRFYPVVVEEAEITDEYWDDVEKRVLADFKWWSLDEINASDAFFSPVSLHKLLPPIIAGDYPSEPIATGA